jgi:hypothetical protein
MCSLRYELTRQMSRKKNKSLSYKGKNTPREHLLWVKQFNCKDHGGIVRIYFKRRAKKQKKAVGNP